MIRSQTRSVEDVIEDHRASGTFINIDGVNTFLLDYGEGEPVFCIHGVPTSSFLYRKVLRELAGRGYRGIAVDLPGLGLSARPDNFDYSFLGYTNFLSKVIDALGLERYHLVVHDIGGPIGFALAASEKEHILSLTILNTWLDVVNFKKPIPMRPFEKPVLGEAELSILTHTSWRVMFNALGVEDSSGISEEEVAAYVDLLKNEDGGKAFLRIMRNFDDSEELRKICYQAVRNVPYPVQAVWGANDPGLTLKKHGAEFKKEADLTGFYELPARHLLQEEQWREIADKIAEIASIARDE